MLDVFNGFCFQIAHHTLVPNTEDFATATVLEGVVYSEEEAMILLMYYMTVLAEVIYIFLVSVFHSCFCKMSLKMVVNYE